MEQLRNYLTALIAQVRGFKEANRMAFALIIGTVATAALLGFGFYMFNPGAPMVLAANLGPADRTALALRLRRHNLGFQLGADSITVASRDLAEARRLLDSSPGFSGGSNDFGLFDRSTLGQSEFDEQINYQRSLQGELERTIMNIHGIDSARVMIAMSRPSPFALAQPEASRASVMLTMAPGAVADPLLGRSVAHLVASSVPGLKAEQVTVTGGDGTILYPPPQGNELSDEVKLRNDIERRLQDKVAALLSRIMGQGRYAVEVAVELDTSRVSTREEIYGNGDRGVLTEEHTSEPAGAAIGGIPGLTSNLPSPTAAATPGAPNAQKEPATQVAERSSELNRKDVLTYKPSSKEVSSVAAPIRIRRVSVAAVLDGTYEGGEFKALPPRRLEAIKGLVAAAIGAQTERGDSINVQSAALSQPYVPPVPNPVAEVRQILSNPTYFYTALGAAALLLMLLPWLVVRKVGKRRKARQTLEAQSAQKAGDKEAAIQQLQAQIPEEIVIPEPTMSTGYADLRRRLNQEVERDPQNAAAILRRWMAGEEKPGAKTEERAAA